MNNPNPFLPEGSFLEQKNKARRRLNIVVYFSISLSVVVLMALLIQGCRKPSDAGETSGADTNTTVAQLPTNPPDMGTPSNTMTPPPETNPPTYTPPPPPPAPPAPPVAATEEYTVVKGDTIATIAKNAHVSQKAVMDANPGVDPRKLKIGQKLHMPAATSAPTRFGWWHANLQGEIRRYVDRHRETIPCFDKSNPVCQRSDHDAAECGQGSKNPGCRCCRTGSSASGNVAAAIDERADLRAGSGRYRAARGSLTMFRTPGFLCPASGAL
jgi:LysM repeat protein